MRVATLERALLRWPAWSTSVLLARSELSYVPADELRHRERWTNAEVAGVRRLCRAALAYLELPLKLSEYWMACFLSDALDGRAWETERIGVPVRWWKRFRPLFDAIPEGSWRIVVSFRGYFTSEGMAANPETADWVRIFPPQLASVTVPKRLPSSIGTPALAIVPLDAWRSAWRHPFKLPVLAEFEEGLVPVTSLAFSSAGDRSPSGTRTTDATVEVPPWAWSDETAALAREQMIAIREWYQRNGTHPLAASIRRAAAERAAPDRGDESPDWLRWVDEYQSGSSGYTELVRRVLLWRTGGRSFAGATEQPKEAKRAADWVAKRLRRRGISRIKLARKWWGGTEQETS